MDGIREKLQDPEERKKTQKKILLPSVFSIAISIAMVAVGAKVNRELNTFIGKIYGIKYLSNIKFCLFSMFQRFTEYTCYIHVLSIWIYVTNFKLHFYL